MASKRRIRIRRERTVERHRKRACEGKQAHLTQTEAVAHAIVLHRRTGGAYETYPCEHCRRWHVGHVKGLMRILTASSLPRS